MDEKLRAMFAKTRLLVSKEDFAVVGLPGVANVEIGGEGFSAVIKERGITTLVLPLEKWNAMKETVKGAIVESPFKVMTFSVPSDWAVPGYISELSRVLTSEGLNLRVISAHSYEHILVKAQDKDRVIKTLEKFVMECKAEKKKEEPAEGE